MIPPPTSPIALLVAATLTGPAAVDAGRAWLESVNLERLPPEQYPLLSLALRAIEQAAPHPPWLPRLRGISRHAWYANQLYSFGEGALARGAAAVV